MTKLITPSRPAFNHGDLISQIVKYSGSKTIDKITLNLTMINLKPQTMVVGQDGNASFQAANFKGGRNTWVFQPVIHWLPENNWVTSGTTIQNTLQTDSYNSAPDAAVNAPRLDYDVFFDQEGVYDLWGYGFTSMGTFWTFDGDATHMRQMNLGSYSGPPQWTKFGTFYVGEGGTHTFSVYLGQLGTVNFDQWYFTQDRDLDQTLVYGAGEFAPLPLSLSPFNTALRVRTLDGSSRAELDSPVSGGASITSWLSSSTIRASGGFNYEIRDRAVASGIIFEDGLSIDYWQIGGNPDYFAAWDFDFKDDSIGSAFVSLDFGKNFTVE